VLVALTAALVAGGAGPAVASAARLVGGGEQAAIIRAFDRSAAHRRLVVTSVRRSTVASSWAIVKAVSPEAAGRTSPHASTPRLLSSFYHRGGGSWQAGSPPAAARADLDQPFSVAVVYSGSGAESIDYEQTYSSACAQLGDLTDTETDTVRPMSWKVRWLVDLDALRSAVRSAQGTVLVPTVSVDAAGSTLDVVEKVARTVQDTGCNGGPTTFACTVRYGLAPAGPLSLTSGLEVGLPVSAALTGACAAEDYTLGPSLFAQGATTALVGRLHLLGGRLPGDPYAPISVSWPADSAAALGFVSSPCQSDSACQDTFSWSGTVTLAPVGSS
jgi:hypothetical protein